MSAKTWVPHFIVVLGVTISKMKIFSYYANGYHLKGSLISRMAEIEL